MTIYTANSYSPWIKQGNRLVKTWPSGLCLIQQDYIAPTKLADYDVFQRGDAIDDATPCIDGAVIFPDPEYQNSGDGLTRCTVSAYGRTNSTGNKTLTKTISEQIVQWYRLPLISESSLNQIKLPTISDQLVWSFVVPKTQAPNVLSDDSLNIYRLNGQALSPLLFSEFFDVQGYRIDGVLEISKPVISNIERADCVNFGAFDEWTVVYNSKLENPVFDFGLFALKSAPFSTNKEFSIILDNTLRTISGNLIFAWNDNYSENSQVLKVWNIDAPNGFWDSSAPRQEMFDNTNNTTYRGGTLRRNVLNEWPPTVYIAPRPEAPRNNSFSPGQGPDRVFTVPGDLWNKPAPPDYVSGDFAWGATFVQVDYDSFEAVTTYRYDLKYITEAFEIELTNELDQRSKYSVVITFVDPAYE